METINPPVELCPHYDLYDQGVVYPESRSRGTDLRDSRGDHASVSVAAKELGPWVEVISKLLQASQIPQERIGLIAGSYIPIKHHGAAEFQGVLPEPESARRGATFYRFRQLPPELRLKIWEMAAWVPPQLIDWESYHDPMFLHLNTGRHMPRAAHACREAWHVVHGEGGRWFRGPNIAFWATPQDILYMNPVDEFSVGSLKSYWDMGFLPSRETVAVPYAQWCGRADGLEFAWIRQSPALKRLILVVDDTASICIAQDRHTVECCGAGFVEVWPRYSEGLLKMITYDDADELQKLDDMWKQIDSQSIWLSKHNSEQIRSNRLKGASIYGHHYISRCVECELHRFQKECLERAKSIWRALGQGGDDDNNGYKRVEGASQLTPIFTGATMLKIGSFVR
ncbi:hypothetical protein PGQ11_006949 [Apiospora arundinis]|uniref:2EXR domain-containing protein n=1 Tax=Apiospora arundinis TaxID=335852 RepID=A0ABR2IUA2_9PEZI